MHRLTVLISLTAISFLILISCNHHEKEMTSLATRIQYDVPIFNNDPQLDWWVNNLEGSKRDPFVKRIMDAVEKGEVKAYDYYNKPMTPSQVVSSMTDTIYQTLLRNRPPYEEYDTMVIQTIDFKDIRKIRFLEEWQWDPEKLIMNKRVLGFGPVVQKEIGGESFTQLLFWIYLDENYPAK
jgi:hypothetical protein